MLLGLLPSWIFSKTKCLRLPWPYGTVRDSVRQGAPWDTHPGHIGACIWVQNSFIWEGPKWGEWLHQDVCVHNQKCTSSISGLVVEYIVAIDVTRVRFPADACITGRWPVAAAE